MMTDRGLFVETAAQAAISKPHLGLRFIELLHHGPSSPHALPGFVYMGGRRLDANGEEGPSLGNLDLGI